MPLLASVWSGHELGVRTLGRLAMLWIDAVVGLRSNEVAPVTAGASPFAWRLPKSH